MIRKSLVLILSLFVFAFSGCENSVSETKPQNVKTSQTKPVTEPSLPKDGKYDAKGVVTKINMEGGSIEINHEEIKDLMPPMQMEFFVSDKSMLKGLKVGDKIDFVIEYKQATEKIISIKKVQ